MGLVVKDGVRGGNPFRGVRRQFSSVEVAVEAGEVAAGDFEPQAVPRAKNIARGPQVDR